MDIKTFKEKLNEYFKLGEYKVIDENIKYFIILLFNECRKRKIKIYLIGNINDINLINFIPVFQT